MFQPSALNNSLARARTDDVVRAGHRIRRVRPRRAPLRAMGPAGRRQSGIRPSPVKSTAASVNDMSAGGTMI